MMLNFNTYSEHMRHVVKHGLITGTQTIHSESEEEPTPKPLLQEKLDALKHKLPAYAPIRTNSPQRQLDF